MNHKDIQLANILDKNNIKLIISESGKIFSNHYEAKEYRPVAKNVRLIKKLFHGKFKGYRACNTEYHDLSHTMDAYLASTRLLDGYNLENEKIPSRIARCLLNAALFHDTGYIQENWDTEGTGAKYTSSHVERSIDFLKKNSRRFNIDEKDIPIIIHIIQCTGLSTQLDYISFDTEEEKIAGFMLGTADILGQMSDRAYLEKLLFLYYEFREGGIEGFNTEFDIIRKTLDFYSVTKKRIETAYKSVFNYARSHFKNRYNVDKNLYIEAIERHMAYLHKIIEDDTSNFRHKLKRWDQVGKLQQDQLQ